MLRSKNQTPPRKYSKESIPYDERYKYSTVESRCSKDCKALRCTSNSTQKASTGPIMKKEEKAESTPC